MKQKTFFFFEKKNQNGRLKKGHFSSILPETDVIFLVTPEHSFSLIFREIEAVK